MGILNHNYLPHTALCSKSARRSSRISCKSFWIDVNWVIVASNTALSSLIASMRSYWSAIFASRSSHLLIRSSISRVLFRCWMYIVNTKVSTTVITLKCFNTNSFSCSIVYSISSENASLIARSRASAPSLFQNPKMTSAIIITK